MKIEVDSKSYEVKNFEVNCFITCVKVRFDFVDFDNFCASHIFGYPITTKKDAKDIIVYEDDGHVSKICVCLLEGISENGVDLVADWMYQIK